MSMTDNPQTDVGDQVIDQYIEELKKTKADPKKKKEFMDTFSQRASQKTSQTEAVEEDPLFNSTVQRPHKADPDDNKSNDDEGIGLLHAAEKTSAKAKKEEEEVEGGFETPARRVIPKGEYKEQDTQESENDASSDSAVAKLQKSGVTFPEELDRDSLDDAQRLAVVLIDNKIKGTKYIIENYVKKTYSTSRKAAERLNELLRDVAIPERTRRIVLTSYYDSLTKKALDFIFAAEQEDDEDEDSTSSRKPRDGTQIVKIALRDKNNKPILDAEGHVITKEVTKDDLYYALQASQLGGSSNSDYIELLMNLQDKRHNETMGYFRQQADFWKQAASGDPVKRLVDQKEDLIKLGLVSDGEKPSDYQTKVIHEAREAGKEVFSETKEEIKSLVTMFRDDIVKPALLNKNNNKNSSGPKDIDDFKDEKDQEDAFSILNEALQHEEKNSKKKSDT